MATLYVHDKSDRTVRKHLVCHMLSSTIFPTRCLSIRKEYESGGGRTTVYILALCNALSIFALGTPSARAFFRALNNAMFLSGSADPPSYRGFFVSLPGGGVKIREKRRTTRCYHDVLNTTADHVDQLVRGRRIVSAYAESARVDLPATLVIDPFLLLDFRPLERDNATSTSAKFK